MTSNGRSRAEVHARPPSLRLAGRLPDGSVGAHGKPRACRIQVRLSLIHRTSEDRMAKVRDLEIERGRDEVERNLVRSEHGELPAEMERRLVAFEVNLSAPWEGTATQCVVCAVPTRVEEVTRVVEDRSRVHAEWIRENARTKRVALVIGAVLFLAGCQVIVFAPSGRETVAAIVGAAMLVVAAGTAGYRRVWGRTPLISVGAGEAEPVAENSAARYDGEKPQRRRSRRR